jgi:hypothetical protein
VREVSIQKQQYTQNTLDVKLGPDGIPFFGEVVLAVLGEDTADLVLIEPVIQSFILGHQSL